MFVREKTVNGYTYLYLVENRRDGARHGRTSFAIWGARRPFLPQAILIVWWRPLGGTVNAPWCSMPSA